MKVSIIGGGGLVGSCAAFALQAGGIVRDIALVRLEEHTSELQSRRNLVCRLLLEKK